MTEPDLKPCPFCGGNNVRAFRHVPMQPDPCVMCRDCYASAVSVAAWDTRDPAVLAALPEVQALIAAAYEVAVGASVGLVNSRVYFSARARKDDDQFAQAIRNLTPADATAALARIEREAEARGRVKGLREAAGIAWLIEDGDRWTRAAAQAAILARADQIEKDAK